MMLDAFRQRRETLLTTLDRLKSLTELRDDHRLAETHQELSRKLVDNQFYLVVLGQFKRGKSTFEEL